jgi:hypothetical protein
MDIPVETLVRVAILTPMDDDPTDPDCRWGAPLMLWGPPGAGKSERITEAGNDAGLRVEPLFLSTAQPEDIGGIPMSDGEGDVTTVFANPLVKTIIKAKRGVIFVDELTCARPAVQGAGLSVVRDRIIANRRLPGGVRIIAAANPPEEAAGGWTLAPPMANRLMHFNVAKPNNDEWAAWCMRGAHRRVISDRNEEDTIKLRWPDVFPKYCALFAGFIKSTTPEKLLSVPKEGHPDRGRAWPSGRTWALARNVAATCAALGPDIEKLRLEFISGCVGDGPAAEWAEWVEKANMPSAEDVLNGRWAPDKRRLDICFAAYNQAIAWTLARPDKEERTKMAIKSFNVLTEAWKKHSLLDVACAATTPLLKAGFTTKHSPAMDAASRELLAKLGDKMAHFVSAP